MLCNIVTYFRKVIIKNISFRFLEGLPDELLCSFSIQTIHGDDGAHSLSSQESGVDEFYVIGGEKSYDIHALCVTSIQSIENVLKSRVPVTLGDLVNIFNKDNHTVAGLVNDLYHSESLSKC